jgi:hypoxanthine phosphoribosyltransferase
MATKTINFDLEKTQSAIARIAMAMYKDNWRPEYIVGITRGGLVPAVMLSHMTKIPMNTLCVQLGTDDFDENVEMNCWMADDACSGKNILIVDDMIRSGEALEWIKKDWQSSIHIDISDIWHKSVRFASLVDCGISETAADYCGEEINCEDENIWVDFFWERL